MRGKNLSLHSLLSFVVYNLLFNEEFKRKDTGPVVQWILACRSVPHEGRERLFAEMQLHQGEVS